MGAAHRVKTVIYYFIAILSTSFTLFAILIVFNASCNKQDIKNPKTKNHPQVVLAGKVK